MPRWSFSALVARHLRPGAMVVCDNTEQYRSHYADYFTFINDPANGFRTMTLPFDGGLELSVRTPNQGNNRRH